MKTAAAPSLGIDLGRTWLRACLADGEGHALRRCRVPAIPWRQLGRSLRHLRLRLGFSRLEGLTIGSPGLWAPADQAAARRLLRRWARRVTALSDVELAHRAAFAGGPGVVVVGGTGSIALARDRRGRERRAGGWGQLLGDEGSGFWIGREAWRDPGLRRRLRLGPPALAPTPENVRRVAALAPRLLRLARTSRRARGIRKQAAQHLARLAAQAAQGLDWGREDMPVSWWGGLFQDRVFRSAFRSALRRASRRARPRPPRLEAEVAAAVLDIDLASPRG